MKPHTDSPRRSLLLTCALAASVAVGGCGTNAFSNILVPAVGDAAASVASLSISPNFVNVLAVGDAVQMSVTATDSNGAPVSDAAIDWTSGDLSVATVSAGGIVTGVGEGRTTVTATSGDASATVIVTVAQVRGLTGTP